MSLYMQWSGGAVWISSTCQEFHSNYIMCTCTVYFVNNLVKREIVSQLLLQPEELKFKDKIHVVKTVAQTVQVGPIATCIYMHVYKSIFSCLA